MTAPKAPAPPTPDQGLSAYQIFALVALACLNMQDGFDILAISFAANAIAESWQIGRASLGFVLSASLFGMMIGAMVLSPLADRIGRKPLTMIGLALSGIGMLIAMAAPSLNVLMIGRALTGFGVGGILASLNTLVAEFAGEKYRGQAVALFQLGFPLGAFFSGFIVAWLLDIGSWRHVFAFGAATSFVFIPIMLLLPESMDFIAKRGRPDALTHINHIRAKFGLTPLLHTAIFRTHSADMGCLLLTAYSAVFYAKLGTETLNRHGIFAISGKSWRTANQSHRYGRHCTDRFAQPLAAPFACHQCLSGFTGRVPARAEYRLKQLYHHACDDQCDWLRHSWFHDWPLCHNACALPGPYARHRHGMGDWAEPIWSCAWPSHRRYLARSWLDTGPAISNLCCARPARSVDRVSAVAERRRAGEIST